MKSSLRVGFGIFAMVVFGGLVAAGVFILFGTQLAVYALVAIVPTLAVVGGLWVRQSVSSAGTDQTQYTRRRARDVGEAFVDVWETRDRMRQEYPDIAADGLGLGVDTLVADMSQEGIEFDRDTGSFTLGDVGNLEDINSLDTRIDQFESDLNVAFVDSVRQRLDDIDSELRRLDDLTPARGSDTPEVSADGGWESVGTTLTETRQSAVGTIDEAAETIQGTISATDDVNRGSVESTLAQARDYANENEFDRAVTELLNARDAVRREGETTFSTARQGILSLLDTVAGSDVDRYLGEGVRTDVSDVRRAVTDLSDAMELSALTEQRERATDRATDIVAELETNLDDIVGRLERADIPDGYYTVPEAADRRFEDELRRADDLGEFESVWKTATTQLTDALDELRPKADVVSGYDQIRDQIERELKSTGRVDATDLPVRQHQEQFLGLYYREHPESVSFDIDEPCLTVSGGTDDYEVTATVQFSKGGPDRDVTVTVGNDSFEATETVTTPLVGTATFESIPFGEYTVRARPAAEEFGTAEQTVQVEADTELSLELPEVTLRDQLCDGLEDEARGYLDQLEDTFAERFDDEGYLTSEMSYRVDQQYVPCLLVLWGERTGNHVAEQPDGTVLVYDLETLGKELENVVAYNIADGESMAFGTLREKFLSAPVPDEVITDIAADADLGEATVAENSIRKQ
jgi:hypothetical protein